MATYRVSEATQVNVAGTVHEAGATFTATPNDRLIAEAVAAGWVTERPAKRTAG